MNSTPSAPSSRAALSADESSEDVPMASPPAPSARGYSILVNDQLLESGSNATLTLSASTLTSAVSASNSPLASPAFGADMYPSGSLSLLGGKANSGFSSARDWSSPTIESAGRSLHASVAMCDMTAPSPRKPCSDNGQRDQQQQRLLNASMEGLGGSDNHLSLPSSVSSAAVTGGELTSSLFCSSNSFTSSLFHSPFAFDRFSSDISSPPPSFHVTSPAPGTLMTESSGLFAGTSLSNLDVHMMSPPSSSEDERQRRLRHLSNAMKADEDVAMLPSASTNGLNSQPGASRAWENTEGERLFGGNASANLASFRDAKAEWSAMLDPADAAKLQQVKNYCTMNSIPIASIFAPPPPPPPSSNSSNTGSCGCTHSQPATYAHRPDLAYLPPSASSCAFDSFAIGGLASDHCSHGESCHQHSLASPRYNLVQAQAVEAVQAIIPQSPSDEALQALSAFHVTTPLLNSSQPTAANVLSAAPIADFSLPPAANTAIVAQVTPQTTGSLWRTTNAVRACRLSSDGSNGEPFLSKQGASRLLSTQASSSPNGSLSPLSPVVEPILKRKGKRRGRVSFYLLQKRRNNSTLSAPAASSNPSPTRAQRAMTSRAAFQSVGSPTLSVSSTNSLELFDIPEHGQASSLSKQHESTQAAPSATSSAAAGSNGSVQPHTRYRMKLSGCLQTLHSMACPTLDDATQYDILTNAIFKLQQLKKQMKSMELSLSQHQGGSVSSKRQRSSLNGSPVRRMTSPASCVHNKKRPESPASLLGFNALVAMPSSIPEQSPFLCVEATEQIGSLLRGEVVDALRAARRNSPATSCTPPLTCSSAMSTTSSTQNSVSSPGPSLLDEMINCKLEPIYSSLSPLDELSSQDHDALLESGSPHGML